MPRAALITVMLALLALSAAAKDPHLDPSVLPLGCASCHTGHGASGSPMLGSAQKSVCLDCHDSEAAVERQKALGRIGGHAQPPIVGADLALPYRHPVNDGAFSQHEETVVVCTSCHSPHRKSGGNSTPAGQAKPSPRDPRMREHQLCDRCHSSLASIEGPASIGQKVDPRNASYHPVRAAAKDRSPSVRADLAGKEINCSDCHGGRPGQSARGIHGSNVRGLLVEDYITTDGGDSREKGSALCWNCHDPKVVLDGTRSAFPLHALHVEKQRTSCATCHDAHGSGTSRSLVPFNDGVTILGVSPSLKTGTLAFVSDSPRSGTCYLTCHGRDHGPSSYGARVTARIADRPAPVLRTPAPGGRRRAIRPGTGFEPRGPRTPDPGRP